MEISIVPSIPLMATTGAVGVVVGAAVAFVWLRISACTASSAAAAKLLRYLAVVLPPAIGERLVPVAGVVSEVPEAAAPVVGVTAETALNEGSQRHLTGSETILAARDDAAVIPPAPKMALDSQGQCQLCTAMVGTMAAVSRGARAPCGV